MHDTAYEIGRTFLEVYWSERFHRILEIGSRNVNGTLRDFCPANADYVGVDLEPGTNVDIVLQEAGSLPFDDATFDIVLSTSCFEHDPMFWVTFASMGRVLKPGGFIYINTPSNGRYHAYPYDNWRFYPDAGLALEAWAAKQGLGLTLVESFTARQKRDVWNDFVMVFAKRDGSPSNSATFLADQFADAFNIRRESDATIGNFSRQPEDRLIRARLEQERDDLRDGRSTFARSR